MARTVLLADDSVTAQNMGRRILMDAGYEVVTVNNGSAALKRIHESHPDLIVLDVYMPGYGGLEVCQRLKEAAETARIPVLLSVGKMEPFKADEAKRVRADGHIVKPFEASELLAALARMEDRIVPQGETGRKTKSGSRRVKSADDALAAAAEEATDRVAYLAEKKRRAEDEAAREDAEASAKQETAPVTSAEPPTAEREAAAPSATPTVEAGAEQAVPAMASGDQGRASESQEWVLGKSLFGKPVPGEPALSESIFEKTAFYKAAFGKTVAEVTADANAPADAAASASAGVPRWMAESVDLTAEESALDLNDLMEKSRTSFRAAVMETEKRPQEQVIASAAVVAQVAPESETANETVNSGEAAFAAAASAGSALDVSRQHSAFGVQPAPDSPSIETSTAEVPAAESETATMAPSEATLAWKNWEHIRESVMSPKKAEAIAESVALIAGANVASQPAAQENPAAQPDSAPSTSASAAPEQGESSIDEIVDSVLADLKPRLMKEIAKKLAAKK